MGFPQRQQIAVQTPALPSQPPHIFAQASAGSPQLPHSFVQTPAMPTGKADTTTQQALVESSHGSHERDHKRHRKKRADSSEPDSKRKHKRDAESDDPKRRRRRDERSNDDGDRKRRRK